LTRQDNCRTNRFFSGTTLCREKTLSAFGEMTICETTAACPRGVSPEGKKISAFIQVIKVTKGNGRLKVFSFITIRLILKEFILSLSSEKKKVKLKSNGIFIS
jgi:hypothetical protein